jgi:hypothetical protein
MLEECRWVYNQTLEAREFAYEQSIKCGLYDTQAMLPSWKETRTSLKLVHSQVLQMSRCESIWHFKRSFVA